MKILVCGGRTYNDWEKVENTLFKLWEKICGYEWPDPRKITIIEGGARGADRLAREFANRYGITCETFLADWEKYRKRAGILRNIEMLSRGTPDLVVAFPGGRGTAHMVRIAKEAGIEVIQVDAESI